MNAQGREKWNDGEHEQSKKKEVDNMNGQGRNNQT
jgi:hypothetical protein